MGFISAEIISEIRLRVDIVQIVGEHVRLKPSGSSYKALCPFHKEKTPSFHVVPDKQIFHCFGCGKGGDVFSFLMEIDHLTFPEVVRFLASRCGVDVPETSSDSDQKLDLYTYLDAAAKYYQSCLLDASDGALARDYLCQRGFSEDTIKQFRIGYAPDSWDSIVAKFGKNDAALQNLCKVSLARPNTKGSGYYDFFRNRLMIPVTDVHGRVAAFGGRVLSSDQQPKYLNSSEGETFNKKLMLFNYKEALPIIRRLNYAVVVEGYLDAISLFQHGIKNVVATLGVAISSEQINLLMRNCDTLYFCFDADEAGQNATLRAVSIQKEDTVNARVISFPDSSDDPDTFIKREGAEQFKKLLEKAKDIYTFLIDYHTKGLDLPIEISVKEKLIQKFKQLVPFIHSSIARSEVIRKISKLLDMDPNLLEKEFRGAIKKSKANYEVFNKKKPLQPTAEVKRQEWVLKHLLENPQDYYKVKALLEPADFSDLRLKKIFEVISFQQEASDGTLKPAEILAALDDDSLVSRLSNLITTLEDRPPEPLMDCVRGLVKSKIESRLKSLTQEIREAENQGDDNYVSELSMEQIELRRKMDLL